MNSWHSQKLKPNYFCTILFAWYVNYSLGFCIPSMGPSFHAMSSNERELSSNLSFATNDHSSQSIYSLVNRPSIQSTSTKTIAIILSILHKKSPSYAINLPIIISIEVRIPSHHNSRDKPGNKTHKRYACMAPPRIEPWFLTFLH